MKIQISKNDDGNTSLKVDGIDLSTVVTKFELSQRGKESPVLNLGIAPIDGIELELPEGIVFAHR